MAYNEDLVVRSAGEVQCLLCDIFIPDENKSILYHLNGEVHRGMYLKRLMIRNNMTVKECRIICLLCKETLKNATEINNHIKSPVHESILRSLKNLVDKDGAFVALPEDITERGSDIYCMICDENIAFTIEDLKSHFDSSRHKRARSITVQPFNGIFSVEQSEDDLWCKICQVYIQNYVEIILEHVDEDVEHFQKLNKILKLIEGQNITIENYLTIATEDKALCRKCDIKVPCSGDNIEAHVNGKKHKNSK